MSDELPRLGLGTYSDDNRDQWANITQTALELGYRHVDTAEVYENESYVGQGIKAADVNREDVFLATKTVHVDVPGPERENVLEAIDGCLDRLGTDYVNLLYVHWPAGVYDPEVTLDAYQDAYEDGRVRNIGVSNFEVENLERARDVLDVPILANQIECHPLLPQDELREYAVEHNHWVVAYCPLARGKVFDVPEIQAVAEKHDASPAQVSLAWLLSKENVAAIPKASSRAHLRDNLAARELELDPEDVERIDGIDRRERLIDREYAPWNK
jgi:2,5-diketo-D-gluconate reductase B